MPAHCFIRPRKHGAHVAARAATLGRLCPIKPCSDLSRTPPPINGLATQNFRKPRSRAPSSPLHDLSRSVSRSVPQGSGPSGMIRVSTILGPQGTDSVPNIAPGKRYGVDYTVTATRLETWSKACRSLAERVKLMAPALCAAWLTRVAPGIANTPIPERDTIQFSATWAGVT